MHLIVTAPTKGDLLMALPYITHQIEEGYSSGAIFEASWEISEED